MNPDSNDLIMRNSIFGWIVVVTGILLLFPLIAMRFSTQVDWSPGDFAIMGVMLITFSSVFVLVARKTTRRGRAIMGITTLVGFLWLWAELAVGIFTNWGG